MTQGNKQDGQPATNIYKSIYTSPTAKLDSCNVIEKKKWDTYSVAEERRAKNNLTVWIHQDVAGPGNKVYRENWSDCLIWKNTLYKQSKQGLVEGTLDSILNPVCAIKHFHIIADLS